MHDFIRRGDRLFCEGVDVASLARRFGTPLYVYSAKTLTDHYEKLRRAFAPIRPLICFSVKSNSNLSILKTLVRRGAGLDIVSGGELARARRVGIAPGKIVYASVGKTPAEIETAIRAGILFFNVESLPELGLISDTARRLKRPARVSIRINPNIDPHTHKYITTGTVESKFGVDLATARVILLNRESFPGVKVVGVHVHIGSQITQAAPFLAALRRVASFLERMKKAGVDLEYFNIGGGLGIIYKDEKPQTAAAYAAEVLPVLKRTGLKIVLEPGRFIVGNAGILVTRVLYVKDTPVKRFVIVDAGMNDLVRPSLYGAHHEIIPVFSSSRPHVPTSNVKVDVVGPICESGDFLARDRVMPVVEPGDLLAVMSAGAYGMSMASNYNSRGRAAEVLVKGQAPHLIRRRETHEDLMRSEKVVSL